MRSISRCFTEDPGAPTLTEDINRPASIWVNVHVNPNQKIDVYWDMFCIKGDSSSSRDGNFTVTSPVKSRLLPQPGKREDSCSVTAACPCTRSAAGARSRRG